MKKPDFGAGLLKLASAKFSAALHGSQKASGLGLFNEALKKKRNLEHVAPVFFCTTILVYQPKCVVNLTS